MKDLNFTADGSIETFYLPGLVPQVQATKPRQYGRSSSGIIHGDHKSEYPWSYSILDRSCDFVSLETYDYEGNVSRISNGRDDWNGSSGPTAPNLGNLQLSVYDKALDRLNDAVRGNLDLATSLAEGKQTYKMLNLVERVTKLMTDMRTSYRREVFRKLANKVSKSAARRAMHGWQQGVKRRNPRFRPAPVKAGIVSRASSLGANGWLEFTYGVSPLINDIYGVATNIVGFTKRYSFKTTATLPVKVKSDRSVYVLGYLVPKEQVTELFEGRVRQAFKINLAVGHDTSLNRWTSLNPLAVAYELFPYSFVIDWFLDIGGYMQARETAWRYSPYFAGGSSSYSHRVTCRGEGSQSVRGRYGFSCSFRNWYESKYYVRTVLTSYPTPQLPRFDVDMGSSRLLSAASLLRQLIRR